MRCLFLLANFGQLIDTTTNVPGLPFFLDKPCASVYRQDKYFSFWDSRLSWKPGTGFTAALSHAKLEFLRRSRGRRESEASDGELDRSLAVRRCDHSILRRQQLATMENRCKKLLHRWTGSCWWWKCHRVLRPDVSGFHTRGFRQQSCSLFLPAVVFFCITSHRQEYTLWGKRNCTTLFLQ